MCRRPRPSNASIAASALFETPGSRFDGFVAPAWAMPPWLLPMLGGRGYRFAEDHLRVYDPANHQTRASVVLNYASRTRLRMPLHRLVSRGQVRARRGARTHRHSPCGHASSAPSPRAEAPARVGRGRLRGARASPLRVMRRFAGPRTLAVTALLAVAYVAFALVHSVAVNIDAGRHDQGTYLWCARVLHETHFDAPTNRSQMPAYLYVQALLYPSDASDADLFTHAKRVSIALSFLLVAALCAFFTRTLPKLEARIAMLVTAFTLFVRRVVVRASRAALPPVLVLRLVAAMPWWTCPSASPHRSSRRWFARGPRAAGLCKGSVQPDFALLFAVLFLRSSRLRHGACWRVPSRDAGSRRAEPLSVLCVASSPPSRRTSPRAERLGFGLRQLDTLRVVRRRTTSSGQGTLGKWWTWGPLPLDQLRRMAKYLRTTVGRSSRASSSVSWEAWETWCSARVTPRLWCCTSVSLRLRSGSHVHHCVRFERSTRAPPSHSAIPYALLYLGSSDYAPISRRSPVRPHALPAGALHLAQSGLGARAEPPTVGCERSPGTTSTWPCSVLAVLHVAFVLPD